MLSEMNYAPFSFDVAPLPGLSIEETPLDFDDLLDIAREFEFTRTITHVWPCDEEPTTLSETSLEDIFSTIVTAEECSLPLPGPTPSISTSTMSLDLVHAGQADLGTPGSTSPAPSVPNLVSLPNPDDQLTVRAETGAPITSILQGWSPPNGSQYLDLDDGLVLPHSDKDLWIPPWLTTFLVGNIDHSTSVIGDALPDTAGTELVLPPLSTTGQIAGKENVLILLSPVQPSPRPAPEPVRPRSATQTNSSQTAKHPHAKPPKPRPHPSSGSGPAAGATPSAKYARPPRGGIPPHLARSVTRANVLRVENERKVIQDAFSSTVTREGRTPSVLREATSAEKETHKVANGGGTGKKPLDGVENDKKEARAAKRARV